MASFPVQVDRVRYDLSYKDKTIEARYIKGWKDDELEFQKSKIYKGVTSKFISNISFYSLTKDWIVNIYNLYGAKAKIRVTKVEKDKYNNFKRKFEGYLHLNEIKISYHIVTLKFTSENILHKLNSKKNEKVELERLDTLDGTILPELKTIEFIPKSRRIFLETKWKSELNTYSNISIESNAGNTRDNTCGLPVRVVADSHGDLSHDILFQSIGHQNQGTTGMMFFVNNSTQNRIINIKDLQCKLDINVWRYENTQWAVYWICLTKYENGINYNLKERIPLYKLEDNHPWFGNSLDSAMPRFTQHAECSFNGEIEVLAGESLALEVFMKADFFFDNHAYLGIKAQNLDIKIEVEEDSVFQDTICKAVRAFEFVERILQIILNKKLILKSSVLGRTDLGYDVDGRLANKAFTHGFWLRGFDALPVPVPATATTNEVVNKYKKMSTSFRDCFNDFLVTENLSLGIKKIGFKEYIILEENNYFEQNFVGINLNSKLNNVEIKVDNSTSYSSIELGYSHGFNNEEDLGLDEPNAISRYSTTIDYTENSYKMISKYIYASYAKEWIRRVPRSLFPNKDHKNDLKIFAVDLKLGGGGWIEKTWEDYFEYEPTGVYSPDTITNLIYSPANLLLKHSQNLQACLLKYLDSKIRYISSDGNATLMTKLINGFDLKEEVELEARLLNRARFNNEIYTFEHELTDKVEEQLNGTTLVDGVEIPNIYGLVKAIDENDEAVMLRIMKLTVKDKTKWVAKKANL